MPHTFHIPVLGLGYSVDTPVKVARFGISSVASIVDDELIEHMREYYYRQQNRTFERIPKTSADYRARRITDYLDLIDDLIDTQMAEMRAAQFGANSALDRYFNLLPEHSELKASYQKLMALKEGPEKDNLEAQLRNSISKGDIDVNIMSKVDKVNRNADGESLGGEFTDALAAMRGYANSRLKSSLVLSAGMNPKLYSYLGNFPDFLPDEHGNFTKKVILKVSDFRSALVQAKFLAKKNIWVSEFRIESGLNCGGHAFATDGYLLGPVLEEFKQNRSEMRASLFLQCSQGWKNIGLNVSVIPAQKITVQGGIGTAEEHEFLIRHYELDGAGWGSPFLLVPETTNVDYQTLADLAQSSPEDFFVSNSSPLGVLFNNFKNSSAEKQRLERIAKGRPGSPCQKKYLVSNTEFTAEPICTASRQYQHLKIKQLRSIEPQPIDIEAQINAVTEKLCLCEGLTNAALLKNKLRPAGKNTQVAICPGPNLAWFQGVYSLEEMVGHIYGKIDLLGNAKRPHMLINELKLYVDHLAKEIARYGTEVTEAKRKYFKSFADQLLSGIAYYKELLVNVEVNGSLAGMEVNDLERAGENIEGLLACSVSG